MSPICSLVSFSPAITLAGSLPSMPFTRVMFTQTSPSRNPVMRIVRSAGIEAHAPLGIAFLTRRACPESHIAVAGAVNGDLGEDGFVLGRDPANSVSLHGD